MNDVRKWGIELVGWKGIRGGKAGRKWTVGNFVEGFCFITLFETCTSKKCDLEQCTDKTLIFYSMYIDYCDQ